MSKRSLEPSHHYRRSIQCDRDHHVRKSPLLFFMSIALTLAGLGCDDHTTGTGYDCSESADPNLVRVLYFGRATPTDDAPNVGTPSTNIRLPQWYADDRVFVASSILRDFEIVRGVFDVEMDPEAYAFRSVSPIEFPHLILGFDYESASDEFLVTYSEAPGLVAVARAQRADSVLQIIDVVADETWMPGGARGTGDGTGAIIYATHPTTQTSGFYKLTWSPSPADSLIRAIDLFGPDAFGFDVRNNQIALGVTSGSYASARTAVLLFDAQTSNPPYVLADLKGSFVSAAIDPSGACVAVCLQIIGDPSNEPGNRLTIVSLEDGSVTPIDVKVRPCTFAIADFVSWSPGGNALALSAGSFTGEGGVNPRELWVRTAVSCP